MSYRLYFARLKCLFRTKELVFWSYLFPIALSTCFFFGFRNLWSSEAFQTISIAYVSETEDNTFKNVLEQAMMKDDIPLFDIIVTDIGEASNLLDQDKIEAYIVGNENPSLYIKDNGINETITKSFLDNYRRISHTAITILSENPNAINDGLMDDLMQSVSFIKEPIGSKKADIILIYYYSLLAFTCLLSAQWGLEEVLNTQADLSPRGERVSVSPISKMKLFLCNIFAAFTAHLGSLIVLLSYLTLVLHVDFGGKGFLVLIVCLLGSLVGLGIGGTIGVWVKTSASTKIGITSAIATIGGFLSGMMFVQVKYIIMTYAPVLTYLNPVSLITDSLYSLYYYDTYDRYILNTLLLSFMCLAFGVLVYLGVRRKNYASI